MTEQEVFAVIDHLSGTYQLMPKMLYGSGLRLRSACVCVSKTSTLPNARPSCAMGREC